MSATELDELVLSSEQRGLLEQHLPHCQLKRMLGQGGMSSVFLATDVQLQRDVAIKLINLDNAGQSVNDGLKEARLLAQLNQPNVVQIYQVIQHGHQIALVMEYLKGQNLWLYQQEHVATFAQKLSWLCLIAKALAAAHKLGIVHCDLKLSNVLLTDDEQVKLVDFGLSQQLVDNKQSPTGCSYGSQAIMSPEQLQHQAIDFRSDLFSFGILAFQLLSGQHPFGAGSSAEIAERIVNAQPMDAHLITPAIPAQLAVLLNQLLAQLPVRRPKDTQLVVQQLEQLLIATSQEDILAQETAPLDAIITAKANARMSAEAESKSILRFWPYVFICIFVLVAVVWSGVTNWQQQPDRFVAVLPPVFSATDDMAKMQQDMVRGMIDDAIRQRVLHTPNLNLIAYRETRKFSDDLKRLAAATGASDIITTDLDCNSLRCHVTFSRLVGDNWTVQQRQQWPMSIESFLSIYNESQYQFGVMFPSYPFEMLSQQQVKEQDYLAYAKLYDQVKHQRDINEQVLVQLELVLQSSPYLFSGYRLYREIVRQLYGQNPDSRFTDKLEVLLDNSPPEFRFSVYHAIEMFWLFMLTEQFDKANSQIHIAQERGIDSYFLLDMQANWFRENSQLKQAIQSYQQAVKIRPNSILLYQLAVTFVWAGDIAGAKQTLNQLIEVLPDDYDGNQLLGSLFMYEGNVPAAIDAYETIVNQHSQSIDLSNLATAYSLIGNFQKSLELSQLAVDKSPEHATWLLNLADIQAILGMTAQAQVNYYKVIALLEGKQSVKSWLERTQAYVHTSQADLAIKALNQAKKLAPDSGEVAFSAALVYAQLNEFTSAVVQVEEALGKDIGVVWFNLPWFDDLCRQAKFVELMTSHSASERCD